MCALYCHRLVLLLILLFTLIIPPSFSQISMDSVVQLIAQEEGDFNKYQRYLELTNKHAISEIDYRNVLKGIQSEDLPDSLKLAFQNNVASSLTVKGFPILAKEYFEQVEKKAKKLNLVDLAFEANLGLTQILSDTKPDLAIEKYRNSIISSDNLNNAYLLPRARVELAAILRTQGDPELALLQLDTAEIIFQSLPINNEIIKALLVKGRIFRRVGDNERAKENYLKALDLCSSNDLDGESKILNNLGNIEHVTGNFDKAVEYYVRSLELKRKAGDKRGMAAGYFNIGAIKSDMKQLDAARDDFLKAIELAKETGYQKLVVRCLSRIAYGYQEVEQFDKAIDYNEQSMALSKEINFVYGIMANQYNLAENYRRIDEIPKSFALYQKALAASRAQSHVGYEGAILTGIAQAYARQNQIQTTDAGNQNRAINLSENDIRGLLLQAKEIAEQTNNVENQIETYYALDAFYENTGEDFEHVQILKRLLLVKDSVFTKEKTESVIEWESKYNAAEKEKEIAQLEADKEIAMLKQSRTRNIYIGSLLLLGVAGWFLYYYFIQKAEKTATKNRELFRSKLSSDLHDDVGSILTGVAMQSELLMLSAPPEKAQVYEKLAEMSREAMGRMRDTVWAIDSRKDTFDDLIDRIQDFSDDTLLASGKSLVLQNNIEKSNGSLKPDVRQAIYLIFKEAITNVIKYSNSPSVESNLEIENNDLKLHIRDFGSVDSNQIKTSGTGLSNMKLRAERLGGRLNYFVDNGFHLKVEIPL